MTKNIKKLLVILSLVISIMGLLGFNNVVRADDPAGSFLNVSERNAEFYEKQIKEGKGNVLTLRPEAQGSFVSNTSKGIFSFNQNQANFVYDGANDNQNDYLLYGRGLNALGIIKPNGMGIMKIFTLLGAWIVIILSYGLFLLNYVFSKIIDLIVILNPFHAILFSTDNVSNPGLVSEINSTLGNGGFWEILRDSVTPLYEAFRSIGIYVVIPLMFGFLIFGLTAFRPNDGGDRVKRFLFRVLFILVGIPFLAVNYTMLLKFMQGSFVEGRGVYGQFANQVMSMYVDTESFVRNNSLRLPSGYSMDVAKDGIMTKVRIIDNGSGKELYSYADFVKDINQQSSSGTITRSISEAGDRIVSETERDSNNSRQYTSLDFKSIGDITSFLSRTGSVYTAGDYESLVKNGFLKDPKYKEQKTNFIAAMKDFARDDDKHNKLYNNGKKDEFEGILNLLNSGAVYQNSNGATVMVQPMEGGSQTISKTGGFTRYSGSNGDTSRFSPLSVFNFLRTDFGTTNAVVNSDSKYGYRSVVMYGRGALPIANYISLVAMLIVYVGMMWNFAHSIIYKTIRRTFTVIAQIPAAMLGSLLAIGRLLIALFMILLELLVTLMTFDMVFKILMWVGGNGLRNTMSEWILGMPFIQTSSNFMGNAVVTTIGLIFALTSILAAYWTYGSIRYIKTGFLQAWEDSFETWLKTVLMLPSVGAGGDLGDDAAYRGIKKNPEDNIGKALSRFAGVGPDGKPLDGTPNDMFGTDEADPSEMADSGDSMTMDDNGVETSESGGANGINDDNQSPEALKTAAEALNGDMAGEEDGDVTNSNSETSTDASISSDNDSTLEGGSSENYGAEDGYADSSSFGDSSDSSSSASSSLLSESGDSLMSKSNEAVGREAMNMDRIPSAEIENPSSDNPQGGVTGSSSKQGTNTSSGASSGVESNSNANAKSNAITSGAEQSGIRAKMSDVKAKAQDKLQMAKTKAESAYEAAKAVKIGDKTVGQLGRRGLEKASIRRTATDGILYTRNQDGSIKANYERGKNKKLDSYANARMAYKQEMANRARGISRLSEAQVNGLKRTIADGNKKYIGYAAAISRAYGAIPTKSEVAQERQYNNTISDRFANQGVKGVAKDVATGTAKVALGVKRTVDSIGKRAARKADEGW